MNRLGHSAGSSSDPGLAAVGLVARSVLRQRPVAACGLAVAAGGISLVLAPHDGPARPRPDASGASTGPRTEPSAETDGRHGRPRRRIHSRRLPGLGARARRRRDAVGSRGAEGRPFAPGWPRRRRERDACRQSNDRRPRDSVTTTSPTSTMPSPGRTTRTCSSTRSTTPVTFAA